MLMGRPQLGLKPKLAAFENNASKHHRHARLPAHKSFKPLHATISPIPPSIRIAAFEPILVCFIAQTIRETSSGCFSGSKEFPDSARMGLEAVSAPSLTEYSV
jgi:hypothetical protein